MKKYLNLLFPLKFKSKFILTKNEQKKMNETKYAYASEDPHESPSFLAFGSQGLPLRHASIMFGHDSPVAHLLIVVSLRIRKK